MASNLTDQVRGIAKVVTAVANGDLKRKLFLEAKGEIAELAETINNMIDTLATFADQVTTVAREVGVEGKLGGQGNVPGAAGTWRDLTDNVNRLAAKSHHAASRHCRRCYGGHEGGSHAINSGGGARRGRLRQRQHQRDDP